MDSLNQWKFRRHLRNPKTLFIFRQNVLRDISTQFKLCMPFNICKLQNILKLLVIASLCCFIFVIDYQLQKKQREEELETLRKQYLQDDPEEGKTIGYEIIGDTIKYNYVEKPSIAIVSVLRSVEQSRFYDIAISTVKCYAKIQGYHYILAEEKDFPCDQKDKFFRRHCIVAKILPNFDAVLFLDADIGVVYPKRRIEEYMFRDFDVVFYDRFYNWEVMAGSYLVKNTPYAIKFLEDFADYESTLPNSFHGTDNGALHFFLAERYFPDEMYTIDLCRLPYNTSRNYDDIFTYEACLRSVFGARTDFDRVKVLKKGTGWARDSWITNSVWNKEVGDFMLHSWKNSQIQTVPRRKIHPTKTSMYEWYNPLVGPIHLDRCHPKNMSWSYEERLVGDSQEIMDSLTEYRNRITRQQFQFFYRMKQYV